MSMHLNAAIHHLNRIFLEKYPQEIASYLDKLDDKELSVFLDHQPHHLLFNVLKYLSFDLTARLLKMLPDATSLEVLQQATPSQLFIILSHLDDADREECLTKISPHLREEFIRLQAYPEGSAGSIMDPHAVSFRVDLTVHEIVDKLREIKESITRSIYITDHHNKLLGKVSFEKLATAKRVTPIIELLQPALGAIQDFLPSDEALENLEKFKIVDIPVIDINGVFLGVIYNNKLFQEIEAQTLGSFQSMVGADKNEKALSSSIFSVRKRLPWLYINLTTAFLAACVVGMFEGLIAEFTALAVLMPVVAGLSGNSGGQAQAVTIRALTVREISVRQWWQVLRKEITVGFINGISIAFVAAFVVFLWSASFGLSCVIFLAMTLALVIACMTGVLVPILLVKFGFDPATSSTIFLTATTDMTGFFSFLGIASLLSQFL